VPRAPRAPRAPRRRRRKAWRRQRNECIGRCTFQIGLLCLRHRARCGNEGVLQLAERIVPRPLVACGLLPVPPPREVVPGSHMQPPGTLRRVLAAPEGAMRLVHFFKRFTTVLCTAGDLHFKINQTNTPEQSCLAKL
jgi:hypothetical protein